MELINILLSVTIFLIMISIGSSIKLTELREIFRRPKKLVLGLVLQIILFPLFAFLIASISSLSPEYKIGLIILAACPGGTLSNFISYLVKADTPLSVGLTSTNSLVILATIPIYIMLAFKTFLGEAVSVVPPVMSILGTVSFLVIVPVLLGSYFRHLHPKKTIKAQKLLKFISSILLAIFFIIKFLGSESAGGIGVTKEMIFSILPWALALNIGGLFLGWGISKIFKISHRASTTMGIEVGLQNTVLALVVTDVILLQPILGHPALIYALFSFWTTLLFGIFMLESNNKIFKRFKKHRELHSIRWKKTLEK
jgi:bile acid:Na+ symporter, BASS family